MKAQCKADISTGKIWKPDPLFLKCNIGGGGNPTTLCVAVFCSAAGSLPCSSNSRFASWCSHSFISLNPTLLIHSHLGVLAGVNLRDDSRKWSKEQLSQRESLMLKGGFFIDACCRREVWLRQCLVSLVVGIIWYQRRPWIRWREVELPSPGAVKERTNEF